jgi:hypothetical protein
LGLGLKVTGYEFYGSGFGMRSLGFHVDGLEKRNKIIREFHPR